MGLTYAYSFLYELGVISVPIFVQMFQEFQSFEIFFNTFRNFTLIGNTSLEIMKNNNICIGLRTFCRVKLRKWKKSSVVINISRSKSLLTVIYLHKSFIQNLHSYLWLVPFDFKILNFWTHILMYGICCWIQKLNSLLTY